MSTRLYQIDLFPRRLKRDVTIETGLGKVRLPSGTPVSASTGASQTDGPWMLVDAYVTPDFVLFGVRIDADDVEPKEASPVSFQFSAPAPTP